MQFVSIDKSTNQALLWFRSQDLADYLNVHRHTIYNGAKAGDFFHIKKHDIYKFNYDLKYVSDSKQFEILHESVVFKKTNVFKNEDIDPIVKKLIHSISIDYLLITFKNLESKKAESLSIIKKLVDYKGALNPCLIRELDIISTVIALIKDYYAKISE